MNKEEAKLILKNKYPNKDIIFNKEFNTYFVFSVVPKDSKLVQMDTLRYVKKDTKEVGVYQPFLKVN